MYVMCIQDVASGKQYLVTLTVGYTEKDNINATVHKVARSLTYYSILYICRLNE
jgi:hypothetical protein